MTTDMHKVQPFDNQWWVIDQAGKAIAGPFVGRYHAEQKAVACDNAAKLSKRKERKCLVCGSPFQSEGAHNRLCNACRSDIGGLPTQMVG